MKKTNKGFSLVELIIVIAIMAILAGALAPALIKYINKSRVSADIQTGNTIAGAIQTAMTNEAALDEVTAVTAQDFASFRVSGSNFATELNGILGSSAIVGKAKKDASGSAIASGLFLVTVNPQTNVVEVYRDDTSHMVYPTVAASMTY